MEKLIQLLFNGFALGGIYALLALGFVVIYKATGIINFAHGAITVLAGYFLYDATAGGLHLPFVAGLVVAGIGIAVVSALLQPLLLNRVIGQAPYTLLMITLGIDIVIRTVAEARYGVGGLPLGVPLTGSVAVSSIVFDHQRIATIVASAVCIGAFAWFFQKTRIGLAMRVTAADPEVARALGVRVERVFALAWSTAGVLGLVAVVFIASLPGAGLEPATAVIAFRAFPAAAVGGIDSVLGAIVGGLLIGAVETLTAGYQPGLAPWLGASFNTVSPYIVMVIIMLLRPQGLFGRASVERA